MARVRCTILLKFIGLVLLCCQFVLHCHEHELNMYMLHDFMSSIGLFCTVLIIVGYFFITLIIIILEVFLKPIDIKWDLFFNIVGCVLFLANGIYHSKICAKATLDENSRSLGLYTASASLIKGILHAGDAILQSVVQSLRVITDEEKTTEGLSDCSFNNEPNNPFAECYNPSPIMSKIRKTPISIVTFEEDATNPFSTKHNQLTNYNMSSNKLTKEYNPFD